MTANQASPARAGLPAAQAATARPHHPADHPAICCRPTDLPLVAVRKKTALYAPLLLGAAVAAVLALAGSAMASPIPPPHWPFCSIESTLPTSNSLNHHVDQNLCEHQPRRCAARR